MKSRRQRRKEARAKDKRNKRATARAASEGSCAFREDFKPSLHGGAFFISEGLIEKILELPPMEVEERTQEEVEERTQQSDTIKEIEDFKRRWNREVDCGGQ